MGRRGFLRNFIFGAEDSLVSTVGLLSGVSFAGLSSQVVVLSGIILILVEAISMGAGAYISEDSVNELDGKEGDNQIVDALVMFFSYLLIGLIPLLPYLFTLDTRLAFYWSVAFSLVALAAVGLFKGHFVGRNPWLSALKITIIGGVVIAVAVAVGLAVKL